MMCFWYCLPPFGNNVRVSNGLEVSPQLYVVDEYSFDACLNYLAIIYRLLIIFFLETENEKEKNWFFFLLYVSTYSQDLLRLHST